ncbi:MAG: alpha/beta fold hydrolase [Hyphomonas sp.]
MTRSRLRLVALAAAVLASAAVAEAGPLRRAMDGLTEGEISSDGTTRTYDIHRPDGLKGPSPLVIMLHGGGGSGKNGARMSGFNALADREGFTVVYPDGTGRGPFLTWNAGHCCAYAMEQKVDDVGFLSDLIDDLVAKGVADPKRVYVTGMSNGAMMTHRAGRELSGKVAAIAPVVGAVFGDEALPAYPVPALILTGALDRNVPAEGGYGKNPARQTSAPNDAPYASAEAAMRYWMSANKCTGEAPSKTVPAYTVRTGSGCAAPVRWYVLTENGHAWPGGQKGSRRGDTPVEDFDASEVIWDFFKTQSRPG